MITGNQNISAFFQKFARNSACYAEAVSGIFNINYYNVKLIFFF